MWPFSINTCGNGGNAGGGHQRGGGVAHMWQKRALRDKEGPWVRLDRGVLSLSLPARNTCISPTSSSSASFSALSSLSSTIPVFPHPHWIIFLLDNHFQPAYFFVCMYDHHFNHPYHHDAQHAVAPPGRPAAAAFNPSSSSSLSSPSSSLSSS